MSIEESFYCSFGCYMLMNWKIVFQRAGGAVRTGMPAWRG
jgi:hypothetical protein